MTFCPNCGAQTTGRFCGTCGASSGPNGGSTPPPTPGPNPTAAGTSELPDNMAGALCYLLGPLTGILFLVMEPYSRKRDIRFHAWQSILVFGGLMVAYVVLAIFSVMLPAFITVLIGFVLLLMNLACLGGWLFLMFQTYNGQKVVLPVVGPIAEKQA